jgi:hypothetical protein
MHLLRKLTDCMRYLRHHGKNPLRITQRIA